MGGRGRAGVCVSNGEDVRRTDRSGKYRLRVDPLRHRFVFVVTPDNARAEEAFYRAVEERADWRTGVDFALEPAPDRKRRTFAFAQFTDFHLRTDGGAGLSSSHLRAQIRRVLSGWTPAFAVITGDLTDRGDVPSLEAFRRVVRTAPCPVFPMFGGHDGIEEREAPDVAEDDPRTRHYEQVLGPPWYSFDWGGRHVVLYPNEDRFFAPPEREAKTHWLWADLRAHREVETVLFTHVPPSAAFLDSLAKTDVTAVFCGHYHSSKAYRYRKIRVFATPAFPFGGIDTSPRGFRKVAFRGGQLRADMVPTVQKPAPVSQPAPLPAPGFLRRRSRPLALCWSRRLGGEVHRAAPVAAENALLFSIRDESGTGAQGVVCLDPETGRLKWRLRTDASVKNAAAAADGLGVAVSVTGRLVAFDLKRGTERWRLDLPGFPDRWIYGAPTVADGVVYAGGKGGYGAYVLETGRPVWEAVPGPVGSDLWPCFAGPRVVGDRLILLVQRHGIVSLDRATGREVWCRELAVEYMYPQPVVAKGRLVTGGGPGEVMALDAQTGATLWRRRADEGRHISGLGAGGTEVFVGTPSGEVQAYSAARGRLRWRFAVKEERLDMTPYRRQARSVHGGPTPVQDRVAVGAGDGFLYLLDRRTGVELDRWGFGLPVCAPPLAVGNRVVAAAFDGLVGCFELM